MAATRTTLGLASAAIVALVACLYAYLRPASAVFDNRKAFEGFSAFVGHPPGEGPRRFAVGLNSCVDLIVPAVEVFEKLGATGEVTPTDNEAISSLKELQESFSFFFQKGGAGERFVSDAELFQDIVTAARKVKSGRSFVGGNAALMGLTIQKKAKVLPEPEEVIPVLMGGGYGPELKDMLPNMTLIAEAELSIDDYHVILEYPKDTEWGGLRSPRANRFIISHDLTNARMKTLEMFEPAVADFKPDVVILSGLHMLEGAEKDYRSKRVEEFALMLQSIPKKTPIHFELASMAHKDFLKEISEKVFPYVDSIGLNEQELELLVDAVGGGPHVSLVNKASIADTAKVSETLFWMLKTFTGPESRLSRVHFHSLTFHTIGHVEDTWANTRRAVAAGSWTCSTRACQNENLTFDQVTLQLQSSFPVSTSSPPLTLNLDAKQGSVGWSRGGVDFHLAPVYICNSPQSTVGLGDSISATGLFYSVFNGR